jgi:ABC-type proline/glycine betaine transport system permease subunit
LVARYRTAVGFNPFREQTRRSSDYVLVGAAVVVVLALLAWAFLS